jgi:hypothetical protein
MEIQPAVMRVDVSRETGEVILLIETVCGFRPVLGWPDKKRMEEFAWKLPGVCLEDDERAKKSDDTNN